MDDPISLSHKALSSLQDSRDWLGALLAGDEDKEVALEQVQSHLQAAASALEDMAHDNELVPDAELSDADRAAIADGHPPYYRAQLIPCFAPQAAFGKKLALLAKELDATPAALPARSTVFDCAIAEVAAKAIAEFEPMHLEGPDEDDLHG